MLVVDLDALGSIDVLDLAEEVALNGLLARDPEDVVRDERPLDERVAGADAVAAVDAEVLAVGDEVLALDPALVLDDDRPLAPALLVEQLDPTPSDELDRDWVASLVAQLADHRAELADLASDTSGAMHPAALAAAVADAVPDDALVVLDGGHVSFWSNSFLHARAPRLLLHDAGMGQLGIGLPYANALAGRHPDRTVVNITGDGSFGFTIAELDTARRYGLKALHVVHNNSSWGVVSVAQQRAGFSFGTDLSGTDYAAIARGFGCHGERVERFEDLGAALQRALDHDGPAVVDVKVRFAPHPMFPAFASMTAR